MAKQRTCEAFSRWWPFIKTHDKGSFVFGYITYVDTARLQRLRNLLQKEGDKEKKLFNASMQI